MGSTERDPQACQPSGRSKPERQWSVFPIRVKQEDTDRAPDLLQAGPWRQGASCTWHPVFGPERSLTEKGSEDVTEGPGL